MNSIQDRNFLNNRILKYIQGVYLLFPWNRKVSKRPQRFTLLQTHFLALYLINSEFNEYFTKTHVEKVKSCR